jgi:HEXXH motif-containing protein
MSVMYHHMPRDTFGALARGAGGPAAIRALVAAQYSKHVIFLRGVFETVQPGERFTAQGYELLARAQQHDPAAAAAVIAHPSVGAWALRTLRGDQALPDATPGGMAAVGAAAAIRAGLPAEIEVPVTKGSVMLPSLGAAAASGPTATVRTSPAEVCSAGMRVTMEDGAPGWQALRRLRAGSLDVLLDDLDPFRMPAASNLASRLSAAETASWGAALRDALLLLDPAVAGEVAAAVRVVVPYTAPLAGHVSSSSPETFGTVAMSRQPDRYTCAATLVHEVQHLKLSALLDLVTLTLPDDGRRFYAPWRTDPRPLSGLLQGAYAFLGVSAFWREKRQAADGAVRQRADAEFAKWRAGAARVAETLRSSGRLTAAGQDFVGEMARVLDRWQREPVSGEALGRACREAELHVARWETENEMPAL